MCRYLLVFLSSFAVFLFSLTPNVNTGDAGELITASYYLGLAHPSGYPLYLMISKTFTFLPLGNMAFKTALVSAVFSSISLAIIYFVIFKVTSDNISAIFTVVMLLTAYSYFSQSVIAKFYPLNIFLIISIFSILFLQIYTGSNNTSDAKQSIYLTAFLSGLITALHHTGILIFGSILFAIFLYRRETYSFLSQQNNIRSMILAVILLFSSGFAINIYLFIRGSDNNFFNVFYVRNFGEFLSHISRQKYGEISTISAASHLFSSPMYFWYAFKNFISILIINFGISSFFFFFPGCIYLLKKDYKIFLFTIISLFIYGPFFAKLSFSSKNPSQMGYYVIAHQYFLPSLAIYALLLGFGFYQITAWFTVKRFNSVNKLLPVTVALLFALMLSLRLKDSNYRINYVPYQVVKDTYSILPLNSIFLASGDNERFQGRYLKLIGRYREDTCHLNAVILQDTVRGFEGCRDIPYSNISPETFRLEFNKILPFIIKNRFYSDMANAGSFLPGDHINIENYSLVYTYIFKNMTGEDRNNSLGINRYKYNRLKQTDGFINPDVCVPRHTTDLFTNQLCDKYNKHLLELINLSLQESKYNQ